MLSGDVKLIHDKVPHRQMLQKLPHVLTQLAYVFEDDATTTIFDHIKSDSTSEFR